MPPIKEWSSLLPYKEISIFDIPSTKKEELRISGIEKNFKVPTKRIFLFFLTKEHKRIGRLLFTVSQYLTWF